MQEEKLEYLCQQLPGPVIEPGRGSQALSRSLQGGMTDPAPPVHPCRIPGARSAPRRRAPGDARRNDYGEAATSWLCWRASSS